MIVDRNKKTEQEIKYDKSVMFLYNNFFGRIILKFVSRRIVSKVIGLYMNSTFSKRRIAKTIKKYNINMENFENKEYSSFNDFFIRRKNKIQFDMESEHFVSPADSKLLIIKLSDDASFEVKHSIYNLRNIINKDLTEEYSKGYALIFRLEICDYHHYHFVDDCVIDKYQYIKGCLHTVQPIALGKYKVYHQNAREYTTLHTKNFNDIIQVEIGALSVGKITNIKETNHFKKGEEKGFFEFGGSSIILFVKDKSVVFDSDILENSRLGKETIVSCGEKIGIKYHKDKIENR